MIELDQSVITIGPPKSGKTTIVRALALQHLRRYQTGIVLMHDVNHQFRDMCKMWPNVATWKTAREQAALAQQPFPRGAAFYGFGEAVAVAKLAMDLGHRHNSAGNVTLPIFAGFDESSMMEGSGSTFIGRTDLQVATSRRHFGIALAYNAQRESALMQAFFEAATDVFVFRQSSKESVRSIEKKIGLPRGALMKLLTAPDFTYAHWQSRRGLV